MLKIVKAELVNETLDAVRLSDNDYYEISEWCDAYVGTDYGLPLFLRFIDANGKQVIASNNEWIVKIASGKFVVVKNVTVA